MAAKANIIFLGYQPCQLVKSDKRFRDHLCRWYQDGEDKVPDTSLVLFNQLTQVMGRDFIIPLIHCKLEMAVRKELQLQ
jgi:hypothetical protein